MILVPLSTLATAACFASPRRYPAGSGRRSDARRTASANIGALAARAAISFRSTIDVAPSFYPALSSFLAVMTCCPILGQRELESSGVRAHAGGGAGEPFISDIGGLLPMALCGRTSL